jgi:hypothetical protein
MLSIDAILMDPDVEGKNRAALTFESHRTTSHFDGIAHKPEAPE